MIKITLLLGGSGFRFWFLIFECKSALVSDFRVQKYYMLHKDTIFSCDNYVTICFSHVKVTQNYYFLNDISTRFVEKCTFHVSFSVLMPIAYLLYNVYSRCAPCGAWTDNNYSLKLIKLRKFPILPIFSILKILSRIRELENFSFWIYGNLRNVAYAPANHVPFPMLRK